MEWDDFIQTPSLGGTTFGLDYGAVVQAVAEVSLESGSSCPVSLTPGDLFLLCTMGHVTTWNLFPHG